MSSTLQARVQARNLAAGYALLLQPLAIEAFRPLVGKKVIKAGNSIVAKYQRLVDALPLNPLPIESGYPQSLNIYRTSSNYTLGWTVRACVQVPGASFNVYESVDFNVGELKGDVLESIAPPLQARCDWNAQEIIRKRAAYRAAQRLADKCRGELFPFGEYDR
jgi:hypothetical protein